MKDIKELMKPRYKVIADYPDNKIPVGTILFWDRFYEHYWIGDTKRYTGINPHAYPHLFKPLEWWEERKPEDMPEYVKLKPEYAVRFYKLSEAKESYGGRAFMFDYPVTEHWIDFSQCEPATESEYLSYKENQSDKTKL